MTTVLDRQLKRQITVDDRDYTVAVDPDGMRLTGKGKRTPEVELRWRDLVSGEAALSVALNASLGRRATVREPDRTPPARASKPAAKKQAQKQASNQAQKRRSSP